MRKSINRNYFYSTALLLLCSILVMGFIQIYLSIGYFRQENDEQLLNIVDNLILTIKELNEYPSQEQLPMIARSAEIAARVSNSRVFLTDTQGSVLLCSGTAPEQYLNQALPRRIVLLAKRDGVYTELGTMNSFLPTRHYIAGKPFFVDDQLAGYIFATTDAASLTVYLTNLLSTFILSAGLMLTISSVLSLILTTRMSTPLRRITDAAKKFGDGDFSARVPVDGADELAQLAITFNNMASNLEKIDSSRHSFMGNIAHELRTPMTTIKGFIDGMLDGTIPPESRDHYLEIVSQEVGRLTRLIKNMLDITKLEAGEYKVSATDYDIWQSITSVVFGAEQRLEANQIHISGFAPNKTMVYADEDLVYQVIYNLMDNAIKFCDVDGKISFKVTQNKGMVTTSIRNTGEGIAPDTLPYVFERFYKEDKSRGLNTTGSGLGLHICKVLINLSGGNIWVESEMGQWCEFSFTLPATQVAPKNGKLKVSLIGNNEKKEELS